MGIWKRAMENLVAHRLFNNVYKDRKVFITGHTGFKGSWLAAWLTMMGAEVTGYSLSPQSTPNHYDLLKLDFKSIIDNITDYGRIKSAIQAAQPEIVFHLAAQALVRRSYKDPVQTYQTNVMGTLNLYEACSLCGSVKAVVSVTSDKVYENKERHQPYKETDQLGGYDMYSSSKACVEIMTNSYRRSFLKKKDNSFAKQIVTARAGNVMGGGDWAEDRLIPDMMRGMKTGEKVVIRNPEAVRPWQHVLEPLSGYLLLGQALLAQTPLHLNSWNFGPASNEFITVREVMEKIKKILPELDYILEKPDSLHEAGLLAVDSSNTINQLKWAPVWTTDNTITKTAAWYKQYYRNSEILTLDNIHEYVGDAMKRELIWTKQ